MVNRNVEIKAKVYNVLNLIEKAKSLSAQEPTIIKQHDVFFNVSHGRLKLREFEDGNGELIYYERPDTEGPKLCQFEKSNINTENVTGIVQVLSAALGKKCVVNKIRKLFLIGQTRVHVDQVEGLGDFMELEVVLEKNQTPEEGEQIAFNLMEKLGVDKANLISNAYADILQKDK